MDLTGAVKLDLKEDLEVKKPHFLIDFQDGYSFRGVIELLTKLSMPKIKFIICNEAVVGICQNENKNITMQFGIDVNKLTKFYVGNVPAKSSIIYYFEIATLNNICSKIKKNSGLRLFKQENSNDICFQHIADTETLSNDQYGVISQSCDKSNEEMPNFKYATTPNINIKTDKIKEIFDKYDVKVIFYDRGLKILRSGAGIIPYYQKFGIVDEDAKDHCSTSQLPMASKSIASSSSITTNSNAKYVVESYDFNATISKALSACISKINPRGVLRFFSYHDKPLLLNTAIGDYGDLCLFLAKNKK